MLQKSIATLSLVTVLSANLAHATTFTCDDTDRAFTSNPLKLILTEKTIELSSDTENIKEFYGEKALAFDPKYRPTSAHTGSHRYKGTNDCGDFALIVDSDMANGNAGHATMVQDCNSDGTGPGYVHLECTLTVTATR